MLIIRKKFGFIRQIKFFATNEEKDQSSWATSFMKTLYSDKNIPQEFQKEADSPGPDYGELARNLENFAAIDKPTFMKHLHEIHQEINNTIAASFENPTIKQLMKSVSSRVLCEIAVESFVGSFNSPRNEFLMNLCLEYAEKNAKDDPNALSDVFYTKIYLKKLIAIQLGDTENFKNANDELLELYEKGHYLATHIIAKEIYKVALGLMTGKQKKSKKEMISKAFELFTQAAEKGSGQSFYYLGEMAQNGDIPGGVDLKYAFDCYTLAACNDSAQAFFRLAQFYKDGMIDGKNPELEYFYTKKAAELGLIEAQHNLACMYLEGKICEYSSIKALAWFKHAGAHGFIHSNYNAAKIFLEGSSDGIVKKNYFAGISLLEEVKKSGKINVDALIDESMKKLKEEKFKYNNQDFDD